MNTFHSFTHTIKQKLTNPLPGTSSHLKMVSLERKEMIRNEYGNHDTKKAGVLILFYPVIEKPHLIFIERAIYGGIHSGQISFPGGQFETQDKSLIQTALRETEEEIGIKETSVTTIGNLSHIYIQPSNFYVLPVVAYLNDIPDFIIDKKEVSKVLNFSWEQLTDKNNIINTDIPVRGTILKDVPCFQINNFVIWGATAMMLSELRDVIDQ